MKRQAIVRPRPSAPTTSRRGAPRDKGRSASRGERTCAQLIEAAGQSFAEQGFDGTTGRDICRRAGVHAAAIVYHFGGVSGLYLAVLQEARRRLVTTEALTAAVDAERDPRRKLAAFLGLIVQALTSPASQSWAGRLFSREFVTPSSAYGHAHDRELAVRAMILKYIVSALTGRPPNDPLVARACISIMAPCAMLLFHRRRLERYLPGIELKPEAAPAITRHLVDFALGGLASVARTRSPGT